MQKNIESRCMECMTFYVNRTGLCLRCGFQEKNGVIHRDISPDNIMITRDGGTVKAC